MCGPNHDTGRYDCAEPHTAKVSGCDSTYLIAGYHGKDQNEAAGRYNEKTSDEPMIVCVK